MDAATFRADFPEFADTVSYPTSDINFHIALAGKLLNTDRWADLIDFGTELFVAHHLVLSQQNQGSNAAGGLPGSVEGPQVQKTVDKVSVSYDAQSVSLEDAGFWNMTSYGIRFLQMARMAGAGGIQL